MSLNGRAVIQDSYDGHLDRDWSCASLRAAFKRLPSDGVSLTLPVLIGRAAGKACDEAAVSLRDGITLARTKVVLGVPDRVGRCWLYRWPPDPASAVDGVRLCFSAGRLSEIQTAYHG